MILIAGGGLAGLSAAYHLEHAGRDYLLVEREAAVGGLCRSAKMGGYTFDHSGHLLCFRDQEMLSWVESLLEGGLASFERRASIFVDGRYVPYPFQAHLGALDPAVALTCLADFVLAWVRGEASPPPQDLRSWVLQSFGEGMGRVFFFPYNRKLWGIPLEALSAAGLEWSIPRPSLLEVVDGALGAANHRLGYNATFHYPTHGSIQALPEALARRLSSVRTSCGVKEVRWKERTAVLDDGQALPYDGLITSVPLPRFLRMLRGLPQWLTEATNVLRWVAVWVLNVGVRRRGVSDYHWIYFPEEEYPFFRVGCYTAFGPQLAPRGRSALYVEVPEHKAAEFGDRWIEACLRGLVRCGIVRDVNEVELAEPTLLPVAYVVHDHLRAGVLSDLRAFLEQNDIHPVGRYGAWGYGTMEQALLQGREAARGLVS